MKKQVLTLLIALMALEFTLFAQSFTAMTPDRQTLYCNITGVNSVELTRNFSNPQGNLTIPASVEYNNNTYYVTSLGQEAFLNCSGLNSVTIPNTVTTIRSNAFAGCVSLRSITIPNSVTTIESYAFFNCYNLNAVSIPSSVISIGDRAFEFCRSMTSLIIPSTVTNIGTWAFDGCSGITSVSIPSSVTSIGDGAFATCSSLTSMSVENGNEVYDSREGCNAIIETSTNTLIASCLSTIIPNSVTSIGNYAFFQRVDLSSMSIPNSVTSIREGAFSNCSTLTSITLPSSLTSIGAYAFIRCSGLTSVNLPGSLTSIGESAFNQCSGLTSVVIPSSVTNIEAASFYNCINLTSMSVEDGNMVYDSREDCNAIIETSINTHVFGCKNTVIPNSVTNIWYDAFSECTGLTSVTIPNSVTRIEDAAFRNCTGLTSIKCSAEMPPTIGGSLTFLGVSTDISLYVPCGKVAAYQAADGWVSFTNIQELPSCNTSAGVTVYTEGNVIVVEGALGNTVTLYDNGSNELEAGVARTTEPLRFEGLTSGTYYVKIGVLPARMKVVVE